MARKKVVKKPAKRISRAVKQKSIFSKIKGFIGRGNKKIWGALGLVLKHIALTIRSFITRKDHFEPVYFWVTILMGLIVTMIVMRFYEKGNFSDTLILGMAGQVVAWVGLYNWNTNKKKEVTNGVKK